MAGLDDCPFSSAFPNYTAEMWAGNAPAGKGYPLVGGGYSDRWQCKYGGGDSVDGEINNAAFSISYKVCVYITGDDLRIMDIRHDGKYDYWQWSNHPERHSETRWMHELEPDRIEKILNTVIPNCRFWQMVQKRAKQLYEGGSTDEDARND